MKILLSTLAILALTLTAPAQTIIKADILKTVQHLQERCHEAESAQAAAQDHAMELQKGIDALAVAKQAAEQAQAAAEAKAAALQKSNDALAARLDKLGWALAAVAGLFAWALASKFAALLPPPWNLIGPISAGIAVAASVFGYLRFLL